MRSVYSLLLLLNTIFCNGYRNSLNVKADSSLHATVNQNLIKLSPMVEGMALSKTIEIHAKTKEMEQSGIKVLSLCVGEPDYECPPEVIQATSEAAAAGCTKYTAVTGELALREAIVADLLARKNVKYSSSEIVVSNGAKQAVLQGLMSVVSPGDDVLIPSPYWTSYPDMVKMCQANPVTVSTSSESSYCLNAEDLRQTLEKNDKISCLILCNPSNPSGGLIEKENLMEIAKILLEFPKVVVISDEIYERLVYDGKQHIAFASLPHMYHRTITINGFSKSHSMTGFRLGYSAAPLRVSNAISKVQSQITSCASAVSQKAALAALTKVPVSSPTWMEDRIAELQKKRDLGYSLLSSIPHVKCPKPTGAFYLLPDVSFYYGKSFTFGSETVNIGNSQQLCLELLKHKQVALVPGSAFGVDQCVRLSYATTEDIIEQSILRLKDFLENLQ